MFVQLLLNLTKESKTKKNTVSECKSWTSRAGIKMTSSFSNTVLPHSSVVLLGNTSEAKTGGKGGERRREGKQDVGILGVRLGREASTHQAFAHSSDWVCVVLEAHCWPCPQRACCDHGEAEEEVHFGSSLQGPWACSEWEAAGTKDMLMEGKWNKQGKPRKQTNIDNH